MIDQPCVSCPHSGLDHNGDGWGKDDRGSFDWFACPVKGCGCRVKGYIINMAKTPHGAEV